MFDVLLIGWGKGAIVGLVDFGTECGYSTNPTIDILNGRRARNDLIG